MCICNFIHMQKKGQVEGEMIFIVAQLVIMVLAFGIWISFVLNSLDKDVFERRYSAQDIALLTDIAISSPHNVFALYTYERTYDSTNYYNVEFNRDNTNNEDFNKVLVFGEPEERKVVWYPYPENEFEDSSLKDQNYRANILMLYKQGKSIKAKGDLGTPNLNYLQCSDVQKPTYTSIQYTSEPFYPNLQQETEIIGQRPAEEKAITSMVLAMMDRQNYVATLNEFGIKFTVDELSKDTIKIFVPKDDPKIKKLACVILNSITNERSLWVKGVAIIPSEINYMEIKLGIDLSSKYHQIIGFIKKGLNNE